MPCPMADTRRYGELGRIPVRRERGAELRVPICPCLAGPREAAMLVAMVPAWGGDLGHHSPCWCCLGSELGPAGKARGHLTLLPKCQLRWFFLPVATLQVCEVLAQGHPHASCHLRALWLCSPKHRPLHQRVRPQENLQLPVLQMKFSTPHPAARELSPPGGPGQHRSLEPAAAPGALPCPPLLRALTIPANQRAEPRKIAPNFFLPKKKKF